jgi:BirA family biotin operon repressor/biotin-[acetyl-CoA-carboxylase] ligase
VTAIRAALGATRFADVRYLARTDSTNADATPLLGAANARGATIVAEYQEAGVGRKGRRWFAPPGAALLFTALLPQPVDASALWAVSFWVALGVAAAVERCADAHLDLVWPNDLHAGAGKVGGILCIARTTANDAWVGCGVGLNVIRPPLDDDLAALEPPPVFLCDLSPPIEREALLVEILRTFDGSLDELREPRTVALRWEQRAALAGTIYRYRRDADGIEREGVAERIGPQGELVVRDASGEQIIDMADVRVTGRIRDERI